MTCGITPSRTAVLVVEDEPLLRMDAVDLIEEAGYVVYEAANADAALHSLASHDDIRILFTDVDMPGSMDGVALSRRVREVWPHIKIVITSGHRRLGEADIPENGCFFPKPYPVSMMTKTLADMARAA